MFCSCLMRKGLQHPVPPPSLPSSLTPATGRSKTPRVLSCLVLAFTSQMKKTCAKVNVPALLILPTLSRLASTSNFGRWSLGLAFPLLPSIFTSVYTVVCHHDSCAGILRWALCVFIWSGRYGSSTPWTVTYELDPWGKKPLSISINAISCRNQGNIDIPTTWFLNAQEQCNTFVKSHSS